VPNEVLTSAIESLASHRDLSADEAAAVLREIMEGRSSESETAGFLVALRAKGETVHELVGLARTMRELATRVEVDRPAMICTAGTGGGQPTFNISTTAAFVAAGAGSTVAKHGNRSATGRSGSADMLEALGARIDLEPAAVAECIESVGFGFMFAPAHHAATRHVVPVRKALGFRTIFNFLGPLTNPAGATRQLMGVSAPDFMDTIAAALEQLGLERALVVSSEDGLDEISASGPTRAVEVREGRIERRTITPEELGVEPVPAGSIGAGEPHESAALARKVLDGEPGADRSIVVLNAAAAIYLTGVAETLEEGARTAEATIDSGAAREALERFIERTQELAPS
jgi:anthranilate phosphoribosyltransferase